MANARAGRCTTSVAATSFTGIENPTLVRSRAEAPGDLDRGVRGAGSQGRLSVAQNAQELRSCRRLWGSRRRCECTLRLLQDRDGMLAGDARKLVEENAERVAPFEVVDQGLDR